MAPLKLFLSVTILTSLLFLLTLTRPCRIFSISSYSFSIKPLSANVNPNPNPNKPSVSGFLAVTEIQETSSSLFSNRRLFPEVFVNNYVDNTQIKKNHDGFKENRLEEGSLSFLPSGLSNSDETSLRDRAKDILSVVVALLFGVVWVGLAAATMYLVWSLFASPQYDCLDDISDVEDKVERPKMLVCANVPGSVS